MSDTTRPSQRWQATPPGDGPRPAPRHAALTGHAGQGDSVGPPHPQTRAHSTWVADSNSPPSGRAVGGGTAPDLRRPSEWLEGTPPGDAFPPAQQRATPAHKGARCGAGAGSPRPHRPHRGPTGRETLAVRSRGRAAGMTAPDTRRPSQRWQASPPGTAPRQPRGTQPPQCMQAKGTVMGPHTHTPAPTAHGWRTPTARPVNGQSGEGKRLTSDAPQNGGRHPPGDAPPPPPQRATLARKGAPCGAGAGSPRPHRPHPGHTGRGTLAARSRGRAALGATAPDTRRPSQRWQATPSGDGPPTPPRHAAPTGHAGQGDSVGPPHPHTRAHSMLVADPNSPPSGRAVGGGTAPDLRRPSKWWKAPPPGTPFRHPHSEQRRKGARCGAGAGSPHPHRPHPGHTGRGTPAIRSRGRAGGGGTPPDTRCPSQWWKAPTLGTPSRHPNSEQCQPARAHAVGPLLGPHARTDHSRDTRFAEPWLPAPEDRRPGEGQRLTPDAPQKVSRPAPRGRPPANPAARRPHRAYTTDPPHGGRTAPSQVGGIGDRTAPPGHTGRSKRPEQDTRRGTDHVEGPYQCRDRARCARHTSQGGGADAAGARAPTHAKGTRGLPERQPD